MKRHDGKSKGRAFVLVHGLTGTPEHKTWLGMIARCENPNSLAYPRYGARGVAVCQRWRGSFLLFLEDMGHRPTPKHSIDRVDRSRGYEPGNCRWATPVEQARNRSSNRRISTNGITLTAVEWAEKLSLPVERIYKRLARGESPDRILCHRRLGHRAVGKSGVRGVIQRKWGGWTAATTGGRQLQKHIGTYPTKEAAVAAAEAVKRGIPIEKVRTGRPTGRSGIRGVISHSSGRWQAVVRRDGKKIHLGTFATKEEAAAAVERVTRGM